MNETRTLANWVAGLKLNEVPEQVRDYAKRFILDNLGCQIAGATLPWSQTYYDVMKATRSGTHATVAYFGDKMSPDDAAFLNSTFNHANETDDTHPPTRTHPGTSVIPAALAIAERDGRSGRDFLRAMDGVSFIENMTSSVTSKTAQAFGFAITGKVKRWGLLVTTPQGMRAASSLASSSATPSNRQVESARQVM